MYNKFSKGEDIRDSITSSSFPALSKIEAWGNSERRVYTILERPIRNLFENSNETSFILNHLQKMFNIGDENFVLSGLGLVKTTGANVYTTLTPGIFVYNENIYSIYPTPYTASRQLETDLGFVKFDGSDYINIFYEDDEFRAEVSVNNVSITVENSARGIGLLENLKTALESASISTTGLKSLVEYQLEPCFIATASTQFINFNGTEIEVAGTASGLNFGSFNNTDVTKNNAVIWTGLITDSIKDNSIDNTKLEDMPAFSIKGNKTNASADPQDISEEDLREHFHMVDTNDIQTISATKTFSADQKIDNNRSLIFKDDSVETGWALINDISKTFNIKNDTDAVISISDANKTTITGEVEIDGKTTINANDIGEEVAINGLTTITGETNIIGTTEVDGNFTVDATDATESIALKGITEVDGKFTVDATGETESIALNGATEITGDFNIATTGTEEASVNDDVIATLTAPQALTHKTYEGLTITDSTGTLTIANGKKLTVNNTLIFAGADSKTMTFPTTDQDIVGRTSTQTLTNKTMSTSSIWNGDTVSVRYGGTGADTFADDAIIVGNGTESIQTPGPTLTSTVFAFGGAGTVKTTGDLTLTPSTKTTTAKLFEVSAGGIDVTGDSTITGITTLKYNTNNELEVQSLGTIIKGNVGITLPITNPSFSITNSSSELVLLVDNNSVDTEKILNTKSGIANTGTITSTGNISVGDAETLSTISSGTITTTGTITASAFANSGTYPLNDINVKKFNGHTIVDTTSGSSSGVSSTSLVLWEDENGSVIKRTAFSSLPVATYTGNDVGGNPEGINGLMTPLNLRRISNLEEMAGWSEGGGTKKLVGTVNGEEADSSGGNVLLDTTHIHMSGSTGETVSTRLSSNAAELTRLKGHVPAGTVASGTNQVMLKNGTTVSWGKITDSQIDDTITSVSPKSTTGTSVENWMPLAFWNSDGNGLLRDHDVVYNQTDNTLTATNVTSRSSRTVKKDIETYNESAFDTLDQIKVVSFHYIADETQADKVGFIAEDSPELVAGINHDKMEMGNCIGLLIKAVQELKKENEELRDIINGYHNA